MCVVFFGWIAYVASREGCRGGGRSVYRSFGRCHPLWMTHRDEEAERVILPPLFAAR